MARTYKSLEIDRDNKEKRKMVREDSKCQNKSRDFVVET